MDLELIKKAVDCLDLPIFIFSNDGSCKYSNSIFLDLIDSKASDKFTLDCSSFWPSFSETLIKNGRQKINFITQQGKKFRVLLDFTGISDEFCLAVVSAKSSDGDDSKDLHKQRIETLGVLAGGIAHDFNNILAGILGHITYLKTILPKEGKHSESLLAIEEGGRKAAKLTQEILNYSRLEEVEKAFPIDPKLVIDRSCSLLRGAFPPNVSIHVNSVEHPIQILADEAKLSQVVVNLLMNAKDALNNNGEIKLDLELMSACDELKQAFNGGDLGASKYLVLRVKDNGSGISPENLKKIFDPYYSTKGLRGTGIGLATVKSIITEFGGAIKVFSEVGKGTEFVIYLPSVLELNDKSSSETDTIEQGVQTGVEKILVVDDEAPVRNIMLRSLEHLGYQVISSSSGSEALDLYSKINDLDLVILDMLMPVLSGEDVFNKLIEMNKDIRVLVISGFSSKESVQRILDAGGKGFLQKPFTIEQLSIAVREALKA